ncbi:MAG: DEAD/DEAH box helicase [Actinobacteria bacterium]|nr:DEAD/DEAH box helicase [Actinomycetota bacterium]
MTTTFAHLGLPNSLVQALARRDIVEPFPVQEVTIPDALAGRDVCGKAPTGSGKTLAFGLPLLVNVDKASRNRPRALILAPTRELAEQIKQDLAPLAKAADRFVFAIYGGVGYGPQKAALRKGVDVLVATPGRLEDLMEQRSVDLSQVNIVVIDEADRMADMGFLPAVRRILDRTSQRRQTMLFSATLDGDIAVLSRDYQRDPVRHETGTVDSETIDARHHFWLVQHHDRLQHTADVVAAAGRSIVFTRTRHGADRVARQLTKLGIGAVAMHGGRSQNQRNRALKAFSTGRAEALIATDVAARGIHIDAVESVIHFDPPADHKDYLHRSGRTARAGASGMVVSLVTGEQQRTVRRMQRDLDLRAPIEAPRLDALHRGGHRIGDPAPEGPRRSASPTRPDVRPKKPQQRNATKGGQSVYVANLPWGATAQDIQTLFGRYGEVHEATIITDRRTGRSKGFGFVDMPQSAARAAIEALHGSELDGRDLTVRLARPRTHHG